MFKKLGFVLLLPALVVADEVPDSQYFSFSVGVQGQQQGDLKSNILSAEMDIPLIADFAIGFDANRAKNFDDNYPEDKNTESAFGTSLYWRNPQKGRVGFAYIKREWEYQSEPVIDPFNWTISEGGKTTEKYASTEFFADSYFDFVSLGYKHVSVLNFLGNSWERDIVSVAGYVLENIRLQYLHSADDFPFGNYEMDEFSFAMQVAAPVEVKASFISLEGEDVYSLGVQYHFQNSGSLKRRDRQFR